MNQENLRLEIEKGDPALRSAKLLAAENLRSDSISRAYYAVLHYVRALLSTRNISAKSHHGAILLFSREFIKTNLMDIRYGRIVARLQKFREEADYTTELSFSRNDVEAGC